MEKLTEAVVLIFKLIQGTLSNYLIKHFTVNNQVHSRNTIGMLNFT